MDFCEFKQYFNEQLIKNNIININNNEEKFFDFMKNTLEWNKKINLTNIKDEREFILKHIIDSLTIMKYIKEGKFIDIGTGGGFPGLPIKIANERLEGVLIDSINKKILTVNDNIKKLKLDNIEGISIRAEQLAKDNNYREMFDYATTRAVSGLSTILEYMLPFLKIGGKAICMKGPNYKEELSQAKTAINILGGELEKIENLKVGEFERNIIIIRKIKNTPKQYPRENGKPVKSPIE